jgi:proteic killer suppression protein
MVERKQFKDKDTEKIWNRIFVKKWSKELQKRTWEEMSLLFSFSNDWNKLKETFGKDLEPLIGKRKGQYNIRVNDQWQICFVWEKGQAYEVELVDYHDEKK